MGGRKKNFFPIQTPPKAKPGYIGKTNEKERYSFSNIHTIRCIIWRVQVNPL